MTAPTEVYVDPSIAADTGTGTSGDPYGDLQFGLDNTTLGSGGTRMNIKAGTDELLSAVLDLVAFTGTPGLAQPLIFEGYTSTAGDGGIGGISGSGSNAVWSTSTGGLWFRNCHLHNCGSAAIYTNAIATDWIGIISCELDNTSGSAIVATGSPRAIRIMGNNIHNIGTYGVSLGTDISVPAYVLYNYFANGTNDFTDAIRSTMAAVVVRGNIFSVDGATNAVNLSVSNSPLGSTVSGNSILASAGTGIGINTAQVTTNALNALIENNLVEGFSGAGGVGYKFDQTVRTSLFAGNAAYNNTTNYSGNTDHLFDLDGDYNEALGASPFDKSGADTFVNRHTYFGPVDTGNVQGGAFPAGARRDKGAVQHADPAGGGDTIISVHRKMYTVSRPIIDRRVTYPLPSSPSQHSKCHP